MQVGYKVPALMADSSPLSGRLKLGILFSTERFEIIRRCIESLRLKNVLGYEVALGSKLFYLYGRYSHCGASINLGNCKRAVIRASNAPILLFSPVWESNTGLQYPALCKVMAGMSKLLL
jgi:hypothetical protein